MARNEPVTVEEYTYTVVFEPDEDAGGYVATCPALPGLVTEGDTLDEARAMAADAIKGYLESLRREGLTPPPSEEHEAEPIREQVTVRLQQARAAGCRRSSSARSSGRLSAPASTSTTSPGRTTSCSTRANPGSGSRSPTITRT